MKERDGNPTGHTSPVLNVAGSPYPTEVLAFLSASEEPRTTGTVVPSREHGLAPNCRRSSKPISMRSHAVGVTRWEQRGPMSSADLRSRVKRGADWLFKRRPKALWRIDLEKLDLASPCNCVLGQEWGDYADALDVVLPPLAPGRPWAVEHGFLQSDGRGYKALTQAWREEITTRREEESDRR